MSDFILELSEPKWREFSTETTRLRSLVECIKGLMEDVHDAEFLLRRRGEGREETPEDVIREHYLNVADRIQRSLEVLGVREWKA